MEDLNQPLISIPKKLHLDNQRAMLILDESLGGEGLHSELSQVQSVALALAIERRRSEGSFYRAYLASLPSNPPCPWLYISLADTDEAILRVISNNGVREGLWLKAENSWIGALRDSRSHFESLADEIIQVTRPSSRSVRPTTIASTIDIQEVLWCLAQVVSRSLGSGDASGLVPYCDLLNHDSSARPPMLQLSDMRESYDQLVITVTSINKGEVKEMDQGEELFISYGDLESDPLRTYLKFGFAI